MHSYLLPIYPEAHTASAQVLVNISQPQFFEHFLSERSGKFVQWFDGFRQIHRENHGVQLINGEFAQSDYTIRLWNLSSGSWLPTSPRGKQQPSPSGWARTNHNGATLSICCSTSFLSGGSSSNRTAMHYRR